jgi:protein-L-isoaspartate(D-aspartate) O-methyltransferase
MSWNETIRKLKRHDYLTSRRVEEAMRAVDRKEFVPEEYEDQAYVDRPLPIGEGQTITAPHMVAMMTEALEPAEDERVLEIGTGSGYQAAVLAQLVTEVHTVERIVDLAEQARERLKQYGNVTVYRRDGSRGLPDEAPFDKILVTAAAPRLPEMLVDQLREGGRLVVPVGSRLTQQLRVYEKQEGELVKKESMGSVRFVPMKGAIEGGE